MMQVSAAARLNPTPAMTNALRLLRSAPALQRSVELWSGEMKNGVRPKKYRGRRYVVEGLPPLPSVTTLLNVIGKPFLATWQVNTVLKHMKAHLMEVPPSSPSSPSGGDVRAMRHNYLGTDGEVFATAFPESQEEREVWLNGLLKDARGAPNKLRDTAANLGTRGHRAIERCILEGAVPADMDADLSDRKSVV
eukprot:TRINITY_DN5452_c0_g2_i2.p1 TRINITY_DN5452_c0_g2~~TRINITY_DN5452_c0_g2_i2.p1  ORF type:complete len:193 (+),score=28.69 TRINITY_DN5452_c0_g2_i2:98-676(+)